jgi:uncharacterized protein YjbI with pentapeptide repeats
MPFFRGERIMKAIYFVALALTLAATGASAEEFNKNCSMGMAMGQQIETNCSVRWENEGKVYCFSSQESKDMFMMNKEENLRKAEAFNAKMGISAKAEMTKEKVTSEQARAMIKAATPEKPADFSGKDLSYQDLSGLDLRNSKFVDTNLFGSDLRGSDFTGVDMTNAYLNLARIEKTNFTNANLSNATVFQPIFEKNNFTGAKLVNTRVIGTLGAVDMSGADVRKGRLGLDVGNQPMGQMKFDSVGGKFVNTNFEGADLNIAGFPFADLRGANLRNTNMYRADLSKADLTGADLTGADLTDADVDGADFTGAKGLDKVKGMASTKGKCVGCK